MKLKQLLQENIRKRMIRENIQDICKPNSDGGLLGLQPDMMLDPGGKISLNVWKQKRGDSKYNDTIKKYEGYVIDDFEGTPPKYAQLYSPDGDNIGKVEFHTEDVMSRDLQTVVANEGSIKKITLKAMQELYEAEEPEVIQQLQNLVDTKSRGKVTDPKTGRKATVDTFTASVVLSLYNRLNDTQKPKYVERGLQYMIDFASRNYK